MALNVLLAVIYPLFFSSQAPLGKTAKAFAYVAGVLVPFITVSLIYLDKSILALLTGLFLSFIQVIYFSAPKQVRSLAGIFLLILAISCIINTSYAFLPLLLISALPLAFKRLDGLRYAI